MCLRRWEEDENYWENFLSHILSSWWKVKSQHFDVKFMMRYGRGWTQSQFIKICCFGAVIYLNIWFLFVRNKFFMFWALKFTNFINTFEDAFKTQLFCIISNTCYNINLNKSSPHACSPFISTHLPLMHCLGPKGIHFHKVEWKNHM